MGTVTRALFALLTLGACTPGYDPARAARADTCANAARDLPGNAGRPYRAIWSACYHEDTMSDDDRPTEAPKITMTLNGKPIGFCQSMSFEPQDRDLVADLLMVEEVGEIVGATAEITVTGTIKAIDPEAIAAVLPPVKPDLHLHIDGQRVGRLEPDTFDADGMSTGGTVYVDPCGLEPPALLQLWAHDTGCGPLFAGRWWAFDGEKVVGLTAVEFEPTEDNPRGIAWTWDDLEGDGATDTLWTDGWPCAPVVDPAKLPDARQLLEQTLGRLAELDEAAAKAWAERKAAGAPLYLLFPGYVRSATDGDRHFIDAAQLARLYGVDPKACKVWHAGWSRGHDRATVEGMIELYPDPTGHYRIPGAGDE